MRLILNKRMLMSKHIHKKFDPVFETEFAKAYFEGVENEPTIPGETITDLILRLGKYKGVIKRDVSNFFCFIYYRCRKLMMDEAYLAELGGQ